MRIPGFWHRWLEFLTRPRWWCRKVRGICPGNSGGGWPRPRTPFCSHCYTFFHRNLPLILQSRLSSLRIFSTVLYLSVSYLKKKGQIKGVICLRHPSFTFSQSLIRRRNNYDELFITIVPEGVPWRSVAAENATNYGRSWNLKDLLLQITELHRLKFWTPACNNE